MLNVTLYSKPECHLCEQAELDLKKLEETIPFKLTIVDIETDAAIKESFELEIPVVEAGPFRLKAPFSRQELKMTL